MTPQRQQPLPKPIVRGVSAEQPPAFKQIAMPAPEAIGVQQPQVATAPAVVDWAVVRQRLQSVGASTFQVSQRPGNQWQFSLVMPTATPGKVHRVDAEAATEAEAIARALSEAERWRNAR